MLQIKKLYAEVTPYGYGDIYESVEALAEEHPDAEVLEGYGIFNSSTGYLVDESQDIYWDKEDAIWDMERIGNATGPWNNEARLT